MYLSQILIYLIVGITILCTAFNPFVGVIAYYVLDLIRPQDLFFWAFEGSRLSFWVAAITLVSWFFHLIRNKKRGNLLESTQNKLMIFFWFTVILSHIFSYYRDVSWISFVRISKMILFYFVAVNLINTNKRIRFLIWSMVLSIGYLAFRGNWQYFILGYHQITGGSFGEYTPLDNNGYAMLFIMIFPFAYFLLFAEKSKYIKITLLILLILLMHAVFLTYSRGGFLGLCVVAIFCILKTKKKSTVVLANILFLVVGVGLAGPPVIERIATIKTHEQDASTMGRREAWKAGFRMMAERPFTGVGLDNFRQLSMFYNPEKVQSEMVAHNAYIHVGAEAGIPAVLIYILLIIFSVRDLGRLRKKFYSSNDGRKYYYPAMVEGSLWGYVVCGMFLTLAWFELFYPMIALTVALKKVTQEQ